MPAKGDACARHLVRPAAGRIGTASRPAPARGAGVLALTLVLIAAAAAPAETVTISSRVTLTEADSALHAGDDVTVTGTNGVLTLSAHDTYGELVSYRFKSLTVTGGAAVVCLAQNAGPLYDTDAKGVEIVVADDLIVAVDASLHADGAGFPRHKGPGGAAAALQGGTHGGRGDNNTKATYGSASAPTCPGSGGSTPYFDSTPWETWGGGAIRLDVGGHLIVNGRLSANGAYGRQGGGAGGSIWIAGGGTLRGTGEIQVSGGQSELYSTCGGGGGRIAIADTVTYEFAGNIRAALYKQGEWGGGVGTVRFPAAAAADFTVRSNQTIVIGNDIVNTFGNLTVFGTLVPGGFHAGEGTNCVIQAANIVIAKGGAITADGWGFGYGRGPAPGVRSWNSSVGPCHGGRGTDNTRNCYGSALQPTSMGSAGARGGDGGGAIKLVVSGALTVDGRLGANGRSTGGAPAGAGGSIWITGGGTLRGNGDIEVCGGKAHYNGAGGGGRIAIDDTIVYAFGGNIRAGYSSEAFGAGPGTVYLPAAARADFTIAAGQTLVIGSGIEYVFGRLTVDGTLDCGGDPVGDGTGIVIRAGNVTIGESGVVKADDRGFLSGRGPAAGGQYVGGTHGGTGHSNPGATYGSPTAPRSFGSGGRFADGWGNSPGRHGGGAIHLVASDTLTINGRLSADGGRGSDSQGASAGGSLWLECGTLAGHGIIRADGGVSSFGGGGGRIAITCRGAAFNGLPAPDLYEGRQSVSGTVTVKGGYNTAGDGPEDGSIFIRRLPFATLLTIR